EAGAVCEVPLGIGDGLSAGIGSQERRALFYATQHEHPLVGGYIGRMPADAAGRNEGMSGAGHVLALSHGKSAPQHGDLSVNGSACRYLVVRKSASSAALLAYVETLPRQLEAVDGDRELYRLW